MTAASGFRPPPPARLKTHLATNAAEPPAPWGLAPVIAGGLALLLLWRFAGPGVWLWAAPLVLLAVLAAPMAVRAARQRAEQARLNTFSEEALRGRNPEALRLGWHLIERLRRSPGLQRQVVATMAILLQRVNAPASAAAAWDWLIDRAPEGEGRAVGWRLRRAMARLACDELADADADLRRARREASAHAELDALLCWADLWQQVATNHDERALELGESALERLRPLGVEAGCAHGLLALAAARRAQRDPTRAAGDDGAAALWWRRAALLLRPRALAARCPPLDELRRSPPAAEMARPAELEATA